MATIVAVGKKLLQIAFKQQRDINYVKLQQSRLEHIKRSITLSLNEQECGLSVEIDCLIDANYDLREMNGNSY